MASKLFGYASGSFTGAMKTGKKGFFELADHGTIFLDEVSELSFEAQAQLLRVLAEKTLMRVGDNTVHSVDIRVLAATNKNLMQMVTEGKFRSDLYYRLNVLSLEIEPLRKRREDILPFHSVASDESAGDFMIPGLRHLAEAHRRAVGHHLSRSLHHRRGSIPDIDDGIRAQPFRFGYHPLRGKGTGFVHHFIVSLQLSADQRLKALSDILAEVFALDRTSFDQAQHLQLFPCNVISIY